MISQKFEEINEITGHEEEINEGLSYFEKAVFILSFCLLFSLGGIGVWSGLLLLTANVDGGGPLGMLMEMLPMDLFLERRRG